jgi:hypothetical protein
LLQLLLQVNTSGESALGTLEDFSAGPGQPK